jgi:hypothetical protein
MCIYRAKPRHGGEEQSRAITVNAMVDSGTPDDKTRDAEERVLFQEELAGWKGYVEWERYPQKKQAAHEILKSSEFSSVCSSPIECGGWR